MDIFVPHSKLQRILLDTLFGEKKHNNWFNIIFYCVILRARETSPQDLLVEFRKILYSMVEWYHTIPTLFLRASALRESARSFLVGDFLATIETFYAYYSTWVLRYLLYLGGTVW